MNKASTHQCEFKLSSLSCVCVLLFLRLHLHFSESRALFTGSVSTEFDKCNFKIRSYNTIHIFKNYFVTVFLIIYF